MARTNSTKVAKLINEEFIPCEFDFEPFIETANILVSEVCLSSGYSSAVLEIIERWLAAHFAVINLGQIRKETIGRSTEELATKIELNLAQTKYGQQALVLDYKGNLAKINSNTTGKVSGKSKLFWGGLGYGNDDKLNQIENAITPG